MILFNLSCGLFPGRVITLVLVVHRALERLC
jgi:hypothetical protein